MEIYINLPDGTKIHVPKDEYHRKINLNVTNPQRTERIMILNKQRIKILIRSEIEEALKDCLNFIGTPICDENVARIQETVNRRVIQLGKELGIKIIPGNVTAGANCSSVIIEEPKVVNKVGTLIKVSEWLETLPTLELKGGSDNDI